MEQDRQKREGEETDFQTPTIPTMCANNCGFFGSSATNNLCSKCYKDLFMSKSKAVLVEAVVAPAAAGKSKVVEESGPCEGGAKSTGITQVGSASAAEGPKKSPNRCGFCSKKVGLMGFKCRCGDVFCSVHRYSEKHNCVFDYMGAGQDAIAKANPIVKADKMEKF